MDILQKIGNSWFLDDVWDLSPLISEPYIQPYRKKLHFAFIQNNYLKDSIKKYMLIRIGKLQEGELKIKTLNQELNGDLPVLTGYLEEYGIERLSSLDEETLEDITCVMKKNGVYPRVITSLCGWIRRMIQCAKDFPDMDIDAPQDSCRNVNVSSYKVIDPANAFLIPDGIWDLIREKLLNEEADNTVRGAMLIQMDTGMRIGEVLRLTTDDLGCNKDGYFLWYHDTYLPIEADTFHVLAKLKETAKQTWDKGHPIPLFVSTVPDIHAINVQCFSKNKYREFMKRHEIPEDWLDGKHFTNRYLTDTFIRRKLEENDCSIKQLCEKYLTIPENMARRINNHLNKKRKETDGDGE